MNNDKLSFLLENGMPLSEVQRLLGDGLTLDTIAENAQRVLDADESISNEPESIVPKLDIISAPDLQRAKLPPVKYHIEGMLPEGTSLVAAASKIGKSWMVLDIGLCITAGEPFMGHKTNKCGVLYLALEDSLSRLQNRMNKILNGKAALTNKIEISRAQTERYGIFRK